MLNKTKHRIAQNCSKGFTQHLTAKRKPQFFEYHDCTCNDVYCNISYLMYISMCTVFISLSDRPGMQQKPKANVACNVEGVNAAAADHTTLLWGESSRFLLYACPTNELQKIPQFKACVPWIGESLALFVCWRKRASKWKFAWKWRVVFWTAGAVPIPFHVKDWIFY